MLPVAFEFGIRNSEVAAMQVRLLLPFGNSWMMRCGRPVQGIGYHAGRNASAGACFHIRRAIH